MKFFQKRWVALIVLVLAIVGSSAYGLYKSPATLPEVEYYNWIADEANLLSEDTESVIRKYNTTWNDKYYALVAVASVKDTKGWEVEDFARDLGVEWGLGSNDMLLLLVEDGDYYVALGDNLVYGMTDTQQSKLQVAIDEKYYQGNFDEAVVSFFRQADVYYAQAQQTGTFESEAYAWEGGSSGSGSAILGIVVVVVLLFALWAILDGVRYRNYRRRVVVTPGIVYRPVFWGRPRRPAPPRRRPTPPPPPRRDNPPRPSSSSRPNRTSRPSRPSGSSFGGGGFGGGSRGSSRNSGSRGGSRGGFGGGGFGGGKRGR